MQKRKLVMAVTMLLLASSASIAQSHTKVKLKDLQPLAGSWEGTLTYLDYSSNKLYSMPAEVEIKALKRVSGFIFSNTYPNEPKANSADAFMIAGNGTVINGATVTSKRKLANGITVIVTERLAKDGNDNKPAIIRVTYSYGKKSFINIKDVQFVGDTEWIKRHEYNYTRK